MSTELNVVLPKQYMVEMNVVSPQGVSSGSGVSRTEFNLLNQKVTNEISRAKSAEKDLNDRINNIEIPEVDLSNYYTKIEVNTELNKKQNTITDIQAIRSGAAKGATAIQSNELTAAINAEKVRAETAEKALGDRINTIKIPEVDLSGYVKEDDLASVATSGSYEDLKNKPTIPSAVTESTVSSWGFTKNTGTYIKPASGIPESDLSQEVQDALSNALRKTSQTLTDAEKEIARRNIGSVGFSDLNNAIAEAITNTLNTAV